MKKKSKSPQNHFADANQKTPSRKTKREGVFSSIPISKRSFAALAPMARQNVKYTHKRKRNATQEVSGDHRRESSGRFQRGSN